METFVQKLQLLVLYAIGWTLPVFLCAWAVCVLAGHGIRPCRAFRAFFVRLPASGRVILAACALGLFVYGSTKNDTTNAPPAGQSAPRRVQRTAPSEVVTADDVARGYRLAGETEGSLPELPAGAVTNRLLRLRGGYDWAFRVDPPGWRFPYRDGVLTGVTVFARGEVRPDVGTLYFPVPVTNGVSLLPEARWNLLPAGDGETRRSVFAHALTPSNSLVLAWRNALVGRDAACPTNVEVELFADGAFAWRTESSAARYCPVLPFDWDGDGLENSVDPEPFTAGPDAHGANAEWYHTVCSNVFAGTGNSDIAFRPDVNTNAYYFVDLVAEHGPAPVYFTADRPSRLGSPVVVARGGETNRVPLLVGIEYAVTSPVPFSVSAASEAMHVEIDRHSETNGTVRWPVNFSISGTGSSYSVMVYPSDPGGEFSWSVDSLGNAPGAGGGMMLMGLSSGCPFTSLGHDVWFTCNGRCGCGGCICSGTYSYEGSSFDVGAVSCGESPEEDDGHPDPDEPTNNVPPSVSVSFDKPVVIFEDAYENGPGQMVAKRSTATTLSVSANGGNSGGMLHITMSGADKLAYVSGFPLPISLYLGPNQGIAFSVEYEGAKASGGEDDIRVHASLAGASDVTRLTSVKIEVVPQVQFPAEYSHRHIFGVCENVDFYFLPRTVGGTLWTTPSGIFEYRIKGNQRSCQYSLDEGSFSHVFSARGVTYSVNTQCLKPQTLVVSKQPTILLSDNINDGQAGGIGMFVDLTVCPSNVSFEGIRLRECVTTDGEHTGYFDQQQFSAFWNHTPTWGAEITTVLQAQNNFKDEAAFYGICPPAESGGWSTGEIIWHIPIQWREISGFSITHGWQELCTTTETFGITPSGTIRVEKFAQIVERQTNGTIRCNGVIMQ